LYGGAPIASPHVEYDRGSDVLRVLVPNGEDLLYDFGSARADSQTIVPPQGCDDRAYLELSEEEAAIAAVAGSGIPALDFTLVNSGYAATTASFEFVADDCTAGPDLPNQNWLLTPADRFLAAAAGGTVQLPGSAESCDPGDFTGELIVRSLEGNAPEVHLPVSLSVGL
jgi:hypothetical protein